MSILFILLGALALTLYFIAHLGLDLPPADHLSHVADSNKRSRSSREDLPLAA
jgi:hypothetical protein